MPFVQFTREQIIDATLKEIWDFISSPKNLKFITPDYMQFDIVSPDLPEKMYPGMIISYKVSPVFNIKTTWVSEITHVKEMEYFVDEQRVGPYRLWHHQHILREIQYGILMKDIVSYQPPYGWLGSVLNSMIIRKKLNEIFDFRANALEKLFRKEKRET